MPMGTLGTWDPENDHLLSVIGIGRKYGILFKKLSCRDAISGSYEVWACLPHCLPHCGRFTLADGGQSRDRVQLGLPWNYLAAKTDYGLE